MSASAKRMWRTRSGIAALAMLLLAAAAAQGQTGKKAAPQAAKTAGKPKLIVMIVVDQMRADYLEKFRGEWSGGLKRMLTEGAWFRAAAYPYAATETCVGHSTVSTGAFPASHGMIANAWWDRELQKMVTCTSDPKAKNVAYAGGTTKGGDSAWRMQVPAFAEELKFQTGGATRVVTFSLKARAAITMAGHKGDAATWFDGGSGSWVTSGAYGSMPFVEDYVKQHPVSAEFGKSWTLSLPPSAYLYDEKATGAVPPDGWGLTFPHTLRGKEGSAAPSEDFYEQWATSPFADTYLTQLGLAAVDALGLGKSGGTDYLGISYSPVDYVGHAYGPRSREIEDVLLKLDKDLAELFAHLDAKVGKGNYVVGFTGDHGVAPTPEDMAKTGVPAGELRLVNVKEKVEAALGGFGLKAPGVARVSGSDIYFAPGVYEQIQQNPAMLQAVTEAILSEPGVAGVYRAEELSPGSRSLLANRTAFEWSYFPGRSGDLFVVAKPYWLLDGTAKGEARDYGTTHGSQNYYDQRVPVILMGYGIEHGEYFEPATPADVAPTFGALTGVTLTTRDGRVLGEALKK